MQPWEAKQRRAERAAERAKLARAEGERVRALEITGETGRKLLRSRRDSAIRIYEGAVSLSDGTTGRVWDVVREQYGSWAGDDFDESPNRNARHYTLEDAVDDYERD